MDCPRDDTLHDLVSAELSAAKRADVLDHVRSCDSCKADVRRLLVLYWALQRGTGKEECPPAKLLAGYAREQLAAGEHQQVEKHVAHCARCASYVELVGMSEEERGAATEAAKAEFHEALAEDLGRRVSEQALVKLLPGREELLDLLWERIVALIRDLRTKSRDEWPVLRERQQLAGALGFAGDPDAETRAAVTIIGTMVYTAWAVVSEEVQTKPDALRKLAHGTATRLGAGKQLATRLTDTVVKLFTRA